jgi:mRNA interferase RelE/StbE
MIYELEFLPSAQKEWDKLAHPLKEQFKKKLHQRLENPCVEKDRLAGSQDCYKIKLRAAGYRLIYKVTEQSLVVQVVAIGKRDKDEAYIVAMRRLN